MRHETAAALELTGLSAVWPEDLNWHKGIWNTDTSMYCHFTTVTQCMQCTASETQAYLRMQNMFKTYNTQSSTLFHFFFLFFFSPLSSFMKKLEKCIWLMRYPLSELLSNKSTVAFHFKDHPEKKKKKKILKTKEVSTQRVRGSSWKCTEHNLQKQSPQGGMALTHFAPDYPSLPTLFSDCATPDHRAVAS